MCVGLKYLSNIQIPELHSCGPSYDHVNNDDLSQRAKLENLQDTVDRRQRRKIHWSRPTSTISKTS